MDNSSETVLQAKIGLAKMRAVLMESETGIQIQDAKPFSEEMGTAIQIGERLVKGLLSLFWGIEHLHGQISAFVELAMLPEMIYGKREYVKISYVPESPTETHDRERWEHLGNTDKGMTVLAIVNLRLVRVSPETDGDTLERALQKVRLLGQAFATYRLRNGR